MVTLMFLVIIVNCISACDTFYTTITVYSTVLYVYICTEDPASCLEEFATFLVDYVAEAHGRVKSEYR